MVLVWLERGCLLVGTGGHPLVLVILFGWFLFGGGFLVAGLGLLCWHFLVSVIIGLCHLCHGFLVGLCLESPVFALLLVQVVEIYLYVLEFLLLGFVRGCI